MTKKIWDFRNFRERKKKDQGGYSLVELMVVIVIMVILASVSIGVYNGYVERAKSAVAYEKGHRIAEALEDLRGGVRSFRNTQSGSSVSDFGRSDEETE